MKVRSAGMLLAWLITAAATLPTSAQEFNVDLGNNGGAPSNTFGAAAGQAGAWSMHASILAPGATPFALIDIAGNATSVTLQASGFAGVIGANNADQPGTTGDTDRLMDDFIGDTFNINSSVTWTFANLANGIYDVYTYAWNGSGSRTVDVNSLGAQTLTGTPWVGGFVQGNTHALHTVTVTDGSISVLVTGGGEIINGFQLVQVPGPGALALLMLAGVCGTRRRRN